MGWAGLRNIQLLFQYVLIVLVGLKGTSAVFVFLRRAPRERVSVET